MKQVKLILFLSICAISVFAQKKTLDEKIDIQIARSVKSNFMEVQLTAGFTQRRLDISAVNAALIANNFPELAHTGRAYHINYELGHSKSKSRLILDLVTAFSSQSTNNAGQKVSMADFELGYGLGRNFVAKKNYNLSGFALFTVNNFTLNFQQQDYDPLNENKISFKEYLSGAKNAYTLERLNTSSALIKMGISATGFIPVKHQIGQKYEKLNSIPVNAKLGYALGPKSSFYEISEATEVNFNGPFFSLGVGIRSKTVKR